MTTSEQDTYRPILYQLDVATRRLAGDVRPREDEQEKRDEAIVELSKLGVPRAVVGRLTGLTRARVQQILDRMGESGATGEAWQRDRALQRMVEYAILERPIPSIGVGIRRESVAAPHVGAGWGSQIRLTDDPLHNRNEVMAALKLLIERAEAGAFDELLTLTPEEYDIVRGRPLAA